MAIVKQYHKDTDTTYVYESVSYWDEEKKQSRSKRRVIGKLDPETGEIIPTGKRGQEIPLCGRASRRLQPNLDHRWLGLGPGGCEARVDRHCPFHRTGQHH